MAIVKIVSIVPIVAIGEYKQLKKYRDGESEEFEWKGPDAVDSRQGGGTE